MSETELAKVLDMKRPYLNAIACGRKNVTLTQLERIAEGLGMTLIFVLNRSFNPTGFYFTSCRKFVARKLACALKSL